MAASNNACNEFFVPESIGFCCSVDTTGALHFFWLHNMHFWLIYDRCKTSACKCLITHFVYEVNSRNTPKCCHFQPLYVQSMFFSCFTKHRNLIWKKKKKNLIHQKFGINEALMKFKNYDKFILIDGDSAHILAENSFKVLICGSCNTKTQLNWYSEFIKHDSLLLCTQLSN